ncbi:MAG TPA: hypothetical protein VMW10_13220 [Alphaproteobacteria bacterium]|nr:hypothetical protein [Alphaproteobacteria bacterium]
MVYAFPKTPLPVRTNTVFKGQRNKTHKRAPEIPGGRITEEKFLDAAIKYLGKDYKTLPNGRYVSKDGLRQVRYGRPEVKNKHHAHFEAYDKPNGRIIENSHVEIVKD